MVATLVGNGDASSVATLQAIKAPAKVHAKAILKVRIVLLRHFVPVAYLHCEQRWSSTGTRTADNARVFRKTSDHDGFRR